MFSVLILLITALFTPPKPVYAAPLPTAVSLTTQEVLTGATTTVPFYSQFTDISSTKWKKVGCGIASLAMVLDYYATSTPSVDTLLSQGIKAGAYSKNGWTYAGLISLAKKYGIEGESRILYNSTGEKALQTLREDLKKGPVIASVHYTFDPKNPIPHLVVLTSATSNTFYYNDPAAKNGGKEISAAKFLAAWKKRYIVLNAPAA